jgi:hypothetical protein
VPALVAVERRNLVIDSPIDLAGEPYQLVSHVDDLVEPSSERIALRLRLLRPPRNATTESDGGVGLYPTDGSTPAYRPRLEQVYSAACRCGDNR